MSDAALSNVRTAFDAYCGSTHRANKSALTDPVAYESEGAVTSKSPHAMSAHNAFTIRTRDIIPAAKERTRARRGSVRFARKHKPITVKDKLTQGLRTTSDGVRQRTFEASKRPIFGSKLRIADTFIPEESDEDEPLAPGARLLKGKISHKFSKAVVGEFPKLGCFCQLVPSDLGHDLVLDTAQPRSYNG